MIYSIVLFKNLWYYFRKGKFCETLVYTFKPIENKHASLSHQKIKVNYLSCHVSKISETFAPKNTKQAAIILILRT